MAEAERAFIAAEERVDGLEARAAQLASDTDAVAAALVDIGINVSPSDLEGLRQTLLQRQEETAQLEHALFTPEASTAPDPCICHRGPR